ncbi:MAG TPA: glycosyltransferase [Candidatus Binatia bacterium]|nr:glycosyltransferase [Candidatus Binatia bacterium]
MIVLACLGVVSLLIWLGVLFHPARPWDFQPVGDDGEPPPAPPLWPSVRILVPARNESESLPHTLPALLRQDYPGDFAVVLIDDRSADGTAGVARRLAEEVGAAGRLSVIAGAPLPPGWVGKVWALAQGAAYCGLHGQWKIQAEADCGSRITDCGSRNEEGPSLSIGKPQYLLLTDADIRHAPNSLRRLVAESESMGLALNSRMVRLRCVSRAERLLIPPFVFFFNLLYPMRRVNERRSSVAAAAGGCVLLATSGLERAGGFACIKDKLIDDVSLARQVKALDEPIRLALSRREVESLRVYDSLRTIWVMVRRTAFTELRYSWVRLAGTVLGITLMFLLPPLWLAGGGGAVLAGMLGWPGLSLSGAVALTVEGLCAWGIMAAVYRPAVRFFGLPGVRCWSLPLAGVLYGAMTVDSAVRHVTGVRIGWRDH